MSEDRRVTGIDDGAARRLAALARTITPEDRRRLAPPPDLWETIAAGLDDNANGRPAAAPDAAPAVGDQHRSDTPIGSHPTHQAAEPAGTDAPSPPLSTGAGNVVPFRRRMTSVVLSAAAAVVLVLGVVALVVSGDDPDDDQTGDLVATSTLEALAEGFEGAVELVEVDGRFELDLDVATLPEASDAYYELWLIKDLETGEMQSLGPVDGSGRVDLPRGLDPVRYATVDISIEPLDGVPTHSGQSVLRGTLDI